MDGAARIVVGVDDSPGGRAALAWALAEADLREAPLEVDAECEEVGTS